MYCCVCCFAVVEVALAFDEADLIDQEPASFDHPSAVDAVAMSLLFDADKRDRSN